jgi:uncharacterized protein (TIGR02453 family)
MVHRMSTDAPTFAGMPDEGIAFLEDLEERNTKEFFDAHKRLFQERVQAPFAALLDAAAGRLVRTVPDLGRPKVHRIYRDLRFRKDRTPYNTSMSGYVAHRAPAPGVVEVGYYVNVGPAGAYVAGGLYRPARPELERLRAAAADEATGPELAGILRRAGGRGLQAWLDPLQRTPKPWPADHPRAELLRARSLTLQRHHDRGAWLSSGELLERVVADWRALVPLNRWLDRLSER